MLPSFHRNAFKPLAFMLLAINISVQAQPIFTDQSNLLTFDRSSVLFDGDGLAGAAWFDYDNDRDLDLFLTNGRTQPNGLFRNNNDGTFTDVAVAAGVASNTGSTGVVIADIDNDGDADIYLSGDGGMMGQFGSSATHLYRNNNNGTFTDITVSAGLDDAITPLSAAFADIDNDGFVDLFVSACGSLRNQQQHPSILYHNNGDGTFTNISVGSGVNTSFGACITFFSDYNEDGLIDLYVGNCNDLQLDTGPIELFRNNGDNTFTDVSSAAGLGKGLWMGFAPGDADNDGDIDLFVSNVGASYPNADSSSAAYYRNNGDGTYTDLRFVLGLDSLPWGWGATMQDFDNDGWLDIYYAGSMPIPPFNVGCFDPERPGNAGTFLYNNGDGTFRNLTGVVNADDLSCYYTSGVAGADYDNDGFVDLLTAMEPTADYPGNPFLWHNSGNSNQYICLKLNDETGIGNREGIGSKVTVMAGGLSLTRERYAGSSFISMNSPWLHFGLGSSSTVTDINVRWPDGANESFGTLAVGQCHRLNRGGTVGLTPSAEIAPITVVPNPASNRIRVTVPGTAQPNQWRLFHATGQEMAIDMASVTFGAASTQAELLLPADWPTGMYTLVCHQEGQATQQVRFVVAR